MSKTIKEKIKKANTSFDSGIREIKEYKNVKHLYYSIFILSEMFLIALFLNYTKILIDYYFFENIDLNQYANTKVVIGTWNKNDYLLNQWFMMLSFLLFILGIFYLLIKFYCVKMDIPRIKLTFEELKLIKTVLPNEHSNEVFNELIEYINNYIDFYS